MCGYFCIGFINFLSKGKSLLEYKKLERKNIEKKYCVTCGKYRKFEKPKISYHLEECKDKDEKLFKEEESIEILKILGLIGNI